MSAASKYQDALASVPPSGAGQTHAWIFSTANLAALSGLSANEAQRSIEDALGARANGKRQEIRVSIEKAFREHGDGDAWGSWRDVRFDKPSPAPLPKTFQSFVEASAGLGEADLWELSPVHPAWPPEEGWKDAVTHLRALFRPDELVACGDTYRKQVRTRAEWCARFKRGVEIPPLVVVNPLLPEGGATKDGKPSAVCDNAVADHRHCLVEFDGVGYEEQIRFWLGFGLEHVRSITFSGNKSLHAVLRVDAGDATRWEESVKPLYERFVRMGADRNCKNPSRTTRLAGAVRADTGKFQKLLFAGEALP